MGDTSMKKLILGLLLLGVPAAAQNPPTNVSGLDFSSNTGQGVSVSGRLRLKFDGSSLLQSINGGAYTPIGGSLAGDVTGAFGSNTVVAFQNRPFSATAPSSTQVIYWNGSAWIPRTLTQDDIGAAFSVTLAASGFSTTQACGATVSNPQFSTSHNQSPASATMQDATDTQTISPATLTAIGYGGVAATFPARSYTVTTVNGTRTWTISVTNSGGVTKTAAVIATYSPHVYFGMAVPGTYDNTFITSLSGNSVSSTSAPRTISYAAGGDTKKAYYAVPTSYTAPATFVDTSTGFGIPYSKVASSVSLPDECGTGNAVTYDLYASDNLLSAAFSGKWN